MCRISKKRMLLLLLILLFFLPLHPHRLPLRIKSILRIARDVRVEMAGR